MATALVSTDIGPTDQTVPNIVQRALEAYRLAQLAAQARTAQEVASAQTTLRHRLASVLGIAVPDHAIDVEADDDHGYFRPSVTVDGLAFTVDSQGTLCLVRTCSKCQKAYNTGVGSIEDLGYLLGDDAMPHWCEPVKADYEIVDPVGDAIALVEMRAAEWGDAESYEQQLEDDRALEKQSAILRIMQTENPLTKKPHSASSAEAVVELDEQYRAYRQLQSDAVVKKFTRRGTYEAAKLRAQRRVQHERGL